MKIKFDISYLKVAVLMAALIIFARTIGPQSTEAKIQSDTSQLIDILVMMRSTIGLYKAMNGGQAPAVDSAKEFEQIFIEHSRNFGHYFHGIPVNPFNGKNTVRLDGPAAGANKAGWRLDSQTWYFQADNDKTCAGL